MKKTGLILLGAIPGLALAYAVLTGYLVKQVRPLPIATLPEKKTARRRIGRRQPVAA
jgi:hypothetical protein